MNNNFISKTNTKINSQLSFAVTFIVDIIVYVGRFGIEYLMGKSLDIYLSNNQGVFENILEWIFNNPAPFTVIVFFVLLFALMLYDYNKSTKLEKASFGTRSPSESYNLGNGSVGKQEAKKINNYFGDSKKKDDEPKLKGVNFPPRWRNRTLSVKNTSLEYVDRCLKLKIKSGLWYHLGENEEYEVAQKESVFYDPNIHEIDFFGYLIRGKKKKIIRGKDGSIKSVVGSEENIEIVFTMLVRDILAKNNIIVQVRLDSDYLYGELFFDDVQFALENEFGEENVEVIPSNKPKKIHLVFNQK